MKTVTLICARCWTKAGTTFCQKGAFYYKSIGLSTYYCLAVIHFCQADEFHLFEVTVNKNVNLYGNKCGALSAMCFQIF